MESERCSVQALDRGEQYQSPEKWLSGGTGLKEDCLGSLKEEGTYERSLSFSGFPVEELTTLCVSLGEVNLVWNGGEMPSFPSRHRSHEGASATHASHSTLQDG